MRINKTRLDVLLVEKGFAETRSKAQAMIMAGQVRVDDELVDKPGRLVKNDAEVSIKKVNPYVSRGGLKLEAALAFFKISVREKTCMDVGASTGGFTDCLLQHGAEKVYAIDVGHRQLHYKLRSDPRVISIEGVNFRYFSIESLKEPIEFATIDVSFISLEKIFPVLVPILTVNGEILALVKPQFEASRSEVKKGVIRDEGVRQKTITKIRDFAAGLRLTVKGGYDSPILGPQGNKEHFLWLEKLDNPLL